ncbi:MAG: efflux RND transporter permease subunit [Pseudomonadota bacterium]
MAHTDDVLEVMDEVKLRVDGIPSFPEQAEKPIISKRQMRKQVVQIQVYGDLNETTRKEFVNRLRDELLRLPDVAAAEVRGARSYEIGIEISETTLFKYGLTLGQVANAIRNSSLDMPGGTIRTENGDIRLRTNNQAYRYDDFAAIVLLTRPDGTRLTLGEIAEIKDAFVEYDFFSRFNGKPSISVEVFSVGRQNELQVAQAVKEFVAKKQETLPEGVNLALWGDTSFYLQGRLTMMLKNLAMGGLLVFIMLTLFLHIKVAFWVLVGLPVCFAGAFAFMPVQPFDVSVNIMSLFGFILILGIVVDDAIIIGESAYSSVEKYGHSPDAVVHGAQRVAITATFGVLTTIAAFLPMMFVTGPASAFPHSIGSVVILCLIFSLIESKLILPSHLAVTPIRPTDSPNMLERIQRSISDGLKTFIRTVYQPFLRRAIEFRYTTLAAFFALMLLTTGLLGSGMIRYVFFPEMTSDFISADLEMKEGASEKQTYAVLNKMEDTLWEVNEEFKQELGQDALKFVAVYGMQGIRGKIFAELSHKESERIDLHKLASRWREKIGEVTGVKTLNVSSAVHAMGGTPIAFKLMGDNAEQMDAVASELSRKLRDYEGIFNIENGASVRTDEIKMKIKPSAEALGLTPADLARQVREAFYGAEAQRIQRGKDEIKVMVRYPREERRSMASLENMYIRTPQGDSVPFASVADVTLEPGYAQIRHIDGERAITVNADADTSLVEPGSVSRELQRDFIPQLLQQYPAVRVEVDGSQVREAEMLGNMLQYTVYALFCIYALLAIPLKSYSQPFIIMSAIPFGIIGAVLGHGIIGMAVSSLSIFGFIALTGVVVNDSLIMVDFINRAIDEGKDRLTAAVEAGAQRFRAITLTSLTTFFGLAPILLETSMQAQMVIPMAVSLAFGILFATVITLILIPCLYVVLADFKNLLGVGTHRASPHLEEKSA